MKRSRIVDKDGHVNVENSMKANHLLTDPVGTIAKWSLPFHLFVLIMCCLAPWFFFALLWHFGSWIHGDLEENHLPDNQEKSGWTPCVYNIYSFTSSFLFSLETQRSIGYGLRGTSHKCYDSVFLEVLQSICAIFIECVISVIIYIKLTRGLSRTKTFRFSQNAVVSVRNGKLHLMFRVINMTAKRLETHICGYIVHDVTTIEGQKFENHFQKISLTSQLEAGSCGLVTPLLPCTMSHTIGPSSPLYSFTPETLRNSSIEVVISLSCVEPNGAKSILLTSYLPSEILWGSHFGDCVEYSEEEGVFRVLTEKLDSVVENETPEISAKELDERSNDDNINDIDFVSALTSL